MNEEVKRSDILFTQKFWEGKNLNVTWQVNPNNQNERDVRIKKCFVLIDLNQKSFGIKLSSKKPPNLKSETALVNIIRKHLKGSIIEDIKREVESGDIWIFLKRRGSEGAKYYIHLAQSKPPYLSLINSSKESLIRFGNKGIFTKKREIDTPLPDETNTSLESITTSLLNELREEIKTPHSETIEVTQEEPATPNKEQNQVAKRLKRKLKTLKKSLEKELANSTTPEELEKLSRKANLLQSYAHLAKDREESLILNPELTGLAESIKIYLDTNLSIGKNISSYYELLKKKQRSCEKQASHIKRLKKEITGLEQKITELKESSFTETAIEQTRNQYNLPKIDTKKYSQAKESKPYKEYIFENDIKILVGKSATDNDLLTKQAKSNDYWFHVVGITGSHVIVPIVKNIRNALPENIVKAASILALYYSRNKNDLRGEVYFTRKGHLKKKKGMKEGKWNIEKSETLFIIYSQEELKEVLNRLAT